MRWVLLLILILLLAGCGAGAASGAGGPAETPFFQWPNGYAADAEFYCFMGELHACQTLVGHGFPGWP